jgi:hypothetical protein
MDIKRIKIIKNDPSEYMKDFEPIDISQYIGNIYEVLKVHENGDVDVMLEEGYMSIFIDEYEIVE